MVFNRRIKKELDDERAEYKQTQSQMIQEKDALMSLEVKVSLLESENMGKDLKMRDLELVVQELEIQIKHQQVDSLNDE